MTQAHNWAEELAKTVGRQVRLYRDKAGWSAQRLADALAELGAPIERSVLANLESGRRKTVSVAEVIALARVLDVPPLSLIYPVEKESELVEIIPGVVAEARSASKWFYGEEPFPDSPDGAGPLDMWLWGDVSVLTQLRQHDRAVRLLLNLVEISRRLVSEVPVDAESREKFLGMAKDAERTVRVLREGMRGKGTIPPPLPAAFAYLEDESAPGPGEPRQPALLESMVRDLDESDAQAVAAVRERLKYFAQFLDFVQDLRSEIDEVGKGIDRREL